MSEMTKKGVVEVVTQNKAGFYSIKIGDDWFSTGSKDAPEFGKGDTITFTYSKSGQWKNADPKSFSVVESARAESAPWAAGNGPAPYTDNRQLSIVYQHSQEMAIRFLDIALSNDALPLPAAKNKRSEALTAAYYGLVNKFCKEALNPVLEDDLDEPMQQVGEDDLDVE